MGFSRGSSPPRDQTQVSCVSCIGRQILYCWATREVQFLMGLEGGETYKCFKEDQGLKKKKKKKKKTMLATLLNLFQRARDFWSQASPLCEHSWKIKGFRMFKVTDLILFTSLMLAFRSGTNWCFGRSMPQKANLGIQCLSVSRGEST